MALMNIPQQGGLRPAYTMRWSLGAHAVVIRDGFQLQVAAEGAVNNRIDVVRWDGGDEEVTSRSVHSAPLFRTR
jgi:hypothetical protein